MLFSKRSHCTEIERKIFFGSFSQKTSKAEVEIDPLIELINSKQQQCRKTPGDPMDSFSSTNELFLIPHNTKATLMLEKNFLGE